MSGPAPSRRRFLGAVALLPAAALPAVAQAAPSDPGADAELIRLCTRFLAISTEQRRIMEADPWAPDEGPLHARYQALGDEWTEVCEAIEACDDPVTLAGAQAVGRVVIAEASKDNHGNLVPADYWETVAIMAAQWLAGDAA